MKNSAARSASDFKVFKGIGQLVTLASAAARKGRLTAAQDLIAIPDAAIVSQKGKIKWVGPRAEMPTRYAKARAVNLRGAVVIPGLMSAILI